MSQRTAPPPDTRDEAVIRGSPAQPEDFPRLVFTAPRFEQVPLAELFEPAVIEAAEDILPGLVQPAADQAAALITDSAQPRLVDPTSGPWPALLDETEGEWWVVPVQGATGSVGLIAVPTASAATDDDRMLLGRLAQTSAVALANLWIYEEEHRTALTLQRSLLPAGLPPLPGLAVAARYQASGEQVEIVRSKLGDYSGVVGAAMIAAGR